MDSIYYLVGQAIGFMGLIPAFFVQKRYGFVLGVLTLLSYYVLIIGILALLGVK